MLTIAQTATLVHGFTMDDVDRAAAMAVRQRAYVKGLLDADDRLETAWHGVVEELYSCYCGWGEGECRRTMPLDFFGLVDAGRNALTKAANDQLRHHGRLLSDPKLEAPNFGKYWLPIRRSESFTGDGFSDRICELIALRTALAILTPAQYDALAALAAFDNNGARAADALGLNYNTFWYRLSVARKRLVEVWYEDTPARIDVREGSTCRRGHDRAEHGTRHVADDGGHDRWECRECKRMTDREGSRRRHAERKARLEAEAEALGQPDAEPAA